VKLLLDECVTRHLKRDLAGHEVHTVEDAGFKGLENGDLLKAASSAYEVLITVDRNLPYQQNLAGMNIAILILAAKRNSYVHFEASHPEGFERAADHEGRRCYSD
jgi:hypothetical protein